MTLRRRVWLRCAMGLLVAGCAASPGRPALPVAAGDRVSVTFDGGAFGDYRAGSLRPVVWPLYAPGGAAVTRAFPLAQVDGEPRDHPQHESLWFTIGTVNGVDFEAGPGRVIEIDRSIDAPAGEVRGVSVWRDAAGTEVGRDFHRLAFVGGDDWRAIDLDITVLASNGPLVLGGGGGGLCVRVRPELSLRGGGILRTGGGRDGAAAFGSRAGWALCAGTLQQRQVAVALFDHPANPGHPAWWQARDYGLLAASPLELTDGGGGAGLNIPAGGQLQFRYRVWIGVGPTAAAAAADAYDDWAAAAR